jgi:hypothetical protein
MRRGLSPDPRQIRKPSVSFPSNPRLTHQQPYLTAPRLRTIPVCPMSASVRSQAERAVN